MKNNYSIRMLLIIAFFSLSLTSCQQNDQVEYLKLSGLTMGTSYHITLQSNPKQAKKLQRAIDLELEKINQLMSTYINDSELSQFNQFQQTNCFTVSKQTAFVINSAIKISQSTQGKFDVTLGPLIAEWGFDKKQTHDIIPSDELIDNLLSKIGYDKLSLEAQCLKKSNPELTINLSAIAKGYGVDVIAKLIEDHQIRNYLVEIGGETASKGINPRTNPWLLAIEVPVNQTGQIQQIFTPNELGVATSGDYRNYFEKNGVRFSHTIDPTTGKPIKHSLVSVTVLHPQTMLADALATAFMVMGSEQALNYANKHKIPVYLLLKSNDGFDAVYNKAFEKHFIGAKQ